MSCRCSECAHGAAREPEAFLEGEEEFYSDRPDFETDYESGDEYEVDRPDFYLESEPQSEYEIIGADERSRVTNTNLAPFRYICNMEYDIPRTGRRSMCTGTLIGPRTVLTAGHCLSGLTPSLMRVIPGRNGSLEPLPATQATRFILAPGFRSGTATDYAIIHLRDPIGNRMGFWSRAYRRSPSDAIGTSISAVPFPRSTTINVHISGYPADMPNTSGMGCRDPRRPRNRCFHSNLSDPRRNRLCGAYQYRSFNRAVSLAGGVLEYLNDTCPGHSGSPVWIKRAASQGGRVLVGIHISGDAPPAPLANRAVHINPSVLRFIAANTR